jgi:signal peptidase I
VSAGGIEGIGARLLAAALALALAPLAFVHPVRISGRSMVPRLDDGEVCLVLRAWCAGAPADGQVWVVQTPAGPAVKRLVGLPGDRVELRDGELWRNGKPAPDPRGARSGRETGGPWAAGQGYFLLGDNRQDSRDSRSWGALPARALLGRILICAGPAHIR